MIFLENRSKRGTFLEFDYVDRSFKFINKAKVKNHISGYFDYCEADFLALYKCDESLFIVCNSVHLPFDEKLKISLLDEVGPHWSTLETENKKRLVVADDTGERINILYPKLEINYDLEDWIQPVSDVELFDSCYWIYNVWKEKRIKRLLELWL